MVKGGMEYELVRTKKAQSMVKQWEKRHRIWMSNGKGGIA